MLQERLTARTVETACAARHRAGHGVGDAGRHASVVSRLAVRIADRRQRQPDGDLGARMLAACEGAGGPALVIGTDCPR